jgi:ATP-dependent HslUV protease ATP-binding subunit HslU
VNSRTENIGARRLHTLLEKLLESLSFTAHRRRGDRVTIDREFVEQELAGLVRDTDLSQFIL